MSKSREGIEKFCLSLIREDDKQIIEYLAIQKHKSEYIKDLINSDLIKKGIIDEEYLKEQERKRIDRAKRKKIGGKKDA